MIPGPAGFQRTEAGIVSVAFLAPFSATQLFGSLTLGRAAAIAFALMLAADIYEERPGRPRPPAAAILLAMALVGLWSWMALSAATWGCNCGGKAGGFTEFVAVGLLALLALSVCPRLRGVTLAATLAGIVLAALLALAGVGSLNSATVDLTQTGGRLSGSFGNANELGFAVALGIPIALAYRSLAGRRAQILLLGAAGVLALTLALTYSRGAVIAAAAGVLAVLLWEARGSRRRIAVVLGGAVAFAAVAGLLYAVFADEREDASFAPVSSALRTLDERDLSGWDSRAIGPIPSGPSNLENRADGIEIRSKRPGEGASFRWGEALPGNVYTLRLRVKSARRHTDLAIALGDAAKLPERRRVLSLGPRWRQLALPWSPRLRSPHATLYTWLPAAAAGVTMADARIVIRGPAGPRTIAIPGRLEGSLYDRLANKASRSERRYVESRLDAAELALRAFRSEPLLGIGWATFPDYADENLEYGQLAVHDQFLALAAELGIVGVILTALLIVALALGIGSLATGLPEVAALGLLAAAAAGLVFVEALPTPQLSVPIALGAAVICAQRRTKPG